MSFIFSAAACVLCTVFVSNCESTVSRMPEKQMKKQGERESEEKSYEKKIKLKILFEMAQIHTNLH